MARIPNRLPDELANVASVESVNALEQKMDRCYSSDRYKDFQDAVEVIVERYLDTDKPHKKLKAKINRQIKDYLEERGLKNKMFWVPTVISLVAALAAIAALFKP